MLIITPHPRLSAAKMGWCALLPQVQLSLGNDAVFSAGASREDGLPDARDQVCLHRNWQEQEGPHLPIPQNIKDPALPRAPCGRQVCPAVGTAPAASCPKGRARLSKEHTRPRSPGVDTGHRSLGTVSAFLTCGLNPCRAPGSLARMSAGGSGTSLSGCSSPEGGAQCPAHGQPLPIGPLGRAIFAVTAGL